MPPAGAQRGPQREGVAERLAAAEECNLQPGSRSHPFDPASEAFDVNLFFARRRGLDEAMTAAYRALLRQRYVDGPMKPKRRLGDVRDAQPGYIPIVPLLSPAARRRWARICCARERTARSAELSEPSDFWSSGLRLLDSAEAVSVLPCLIGC